MILQGVAAFTAGGLAVAIYPRIHLLEQITPLLAAQRVIARAVDSEDIQQIIWMMRKVIFLHSSDPEISFAVIVAINDDPVLVRKLLSYIRDQFIIRVEFKDDDGYIIEWNDMLAEIIDEAIASSNADGIDAIHVVALPENGHQ